MQCRYCGAKMMKINEWLAKDLQDFSETNYLCPHCEAECDVSEPYGEDWKEGCIPDKEEDDEL